MKTNFITSIKSQTIAARNGKIYLYIGDSNRYICQWGAIESDAPQSIHSTTENYQANGIKSKISVVATGNDNDDDDDNPETSKIAKKNSTLTHITVNATMLGKFLTIWPRVRKTQTLRIQG